MSNSVPTCTPFQLLGNYTNFIKGCATDSPPIFIFGMPSWSESSDVPSTTPLNESSLSKAPSPLILQELVTFSSDFQWTLAHLVDRIKLQVLGVLRCMTMLPIHFLLRLCMFMSACFPLMATIY